MTTDFIHLPSAGTLGGTEAVPLQLAAGGPGSTQQTPLNALIAAAIGFALGLFIPASGDTSGITDLANMNAAATKAANSAVLYNGTFRVNTGYRLGPGTFYLVNACPLLLPTQINHNTTGIKCQGMGSQATRIDYTPSVAGTPFLTNQWLIGTVFQDISFVGHDLTADFLASVEGTGGGGNIQDYHFYRCQWGGNWNNIFNLTGTNNNSEWMVSQCTLSGAIAGSWLFVAPGVGSGGDQFLNFWFDDCKFNPGTGSWVTLNWGGSVRITAGDASGWLPTTPTYIFNLLGFTHSRGVTSFSCDKLRMEMGNSNCLFLHSQWPTGNVAFDMVTQDTNSTTYPSTNDTVLIEIGNGQGACTTFQNCSFVGQHAYSYAANAFNFQSNFAYKNCNILQYPNAASFCSFIELATNKGGAPVVEFDISCRGNDPTEIFPTTLNWQFSTSGITYPKTVQFTGSNTQAPVNLGTWSRKLPVNAVLREVRWNLGGTVAGAYGLAMQSSELTPTVLSNFSGSNAATPANPAATPCNFWMTNDAQRTIALVETAGRTATFANYLATVTYDG